MNKKKIDKKNLFTRCASGAVLFVMLFLTGWFGGTALISFVFLISFAGLFEFYRLFGIHKSLQGIFGYLFNTAFYLLVFFSKTEYLLPLFILFFFLNAGAYVFGFSKTDYIKTAAGIFGVVYVSLLLSFLFRIRLMSDGRILFFLVFIASWGADVCAYFTGITLGKHKMSPVLSPKKSVEGAIGGILGAVLLGFLYFLLTKERLSTDNGALLFIIASFFGALISIVGDLFASAFKRNLSIKDYSHIIPGHGGILDRFDSVIFVAPVIYYVAELIL